MSILAITSVYANPIHPWHIECLDLSKSETGADELWVIINNDHQAELKRWIQSFQDEQFRMKVVESLKPVDRVFLSIDKDGSVSESLKFLIAQAKASWKYNTIVFTKGWDRFATEIPEAKILREEWVDIIDGLWAKTHNSSDMLKRAQEQKIKDAADKIDLEKKLAELPENIREMNYLEVGNRPWGVYYVLEDSPMYKVKKIIVQPGKRLSLQSHQHRAEHWIIVSGFASVDIRNPSHKDIEQVRVHGPNEWAYIPQWYLHRLYNHRDEPLVIIEVQCGKYTGEDDIIRYDDDFGRK
jgi:mannose-6-phosphate isomerase-like protein (cupin superfamily)/glycerol-3-phosphate cytidylyltransferase-like family protein